MSRQSRLTSISPPLVDYPDMPKPTLLGKNHVLVWYGTQVARLRWSANWAIYDKKASIDKDEPLLTGTIAKLSATELKAERAAYAVGRAELESFELGEIEAA